MNTLRSYAPLLILMVLFGLALHYLHLHAQVLPHYNQ